MPEPVVINGKKFITSKEAARLTGYARDYVGQLVRMGKVEGKVVEKVLFVNEESLLAHVALKNSNTKVVENSFKTALAAKLASAIAVKKNVSTLIYNQTDGSNFLPKISKVNVKKAEPVVAPKKLVSKYAKVSPAKEVAARVAPYADALGKVGSYAIKHAIGFAILFAVLTTSYASIQTPDLFFSRVSEIISQSSRQNAITSDTDAQVASVFSPFNSFAQKLNHNINEFFGIGGEGTTIVQLPSKVQVATTTVVKEIVRDIGTTTVVQYITARPTITAAPVAGDSVLATEFQNYKIFQQNQLEGIFDSIRRGRSTSSTGGDTINNYNATGTTTLTNLTVENTSTSTIPSLNITSSLTLNGDTITDLVGSGLEVSNGVLSATAGAGFSTTSANYHFDNRLAATTTLNNLTTLRGLTDIIATNATVTNLTIGSDYITDITGSGLTVTNGALTVSGASGFSTTSADYWETTQSRWSTSSDSLAFDTRLAATTTLNNLTTLRGLTDIIATNATVTTLAIGSDYITDLTGSGLVVTNGALTVDSSGNWATTSDSYAFDTRLAATTTLNNITTLGSLSLPITQTTGTLSVSRGGTGQTSFGQGWLSSDGTTITSSTSPTVAYITATSTTATSTLPLLSTNAISINGQYFTSFWSTTTDSLAFDTRLAATTTLNNLTTLRGLTDLISTRATTTNATSTNFFATLASTTNIFVGNNLSIGTSSQSASINIERPDGLNALFLGRSGAGGSTLGINFAGGIPTLSPTAGALNIASQLTDASIKTMRLTFAHYNAVTSGQICAVVGGTDATSNSIGIGGGSAGCNSATNVALYTASDTTTTTGTVGFVLNNLQNVGIGTQTPTARLNVQGRSGSTTDIFTVASSTGAELFIVKSTGNVGVGTSTPTQAFSVNGNVWITGNATSSTFTATSTTATSTLPLLSTNALSLNGTYVTSLWGTTSDSYAFDTRLAATTTLNNLTKIGTQSTFAFTNATGSSLYLTSLNCTTNNNGGKITTDSSGQLVCANDQTGSGGSGGGTDVNWTFINGSGIAVSTTSNQVVIGASATSTSQKLEVTGGIYLNGSLGIGTTSPAYPLSVNGNAFVTGQVIASYFSATSTNATSTLPSLSTTNLAVGSDYITDLTGTGLSIVNGVLTATNEGTWATTSDSYAFDTRLAATTTLNNITTLLGLTDLISTRATTTNATSTSLYVTTLGIGSDYITDLTGTNLSIVNGALTAADLTFSTTSADYWETTQSRWSTSSDSLAFDTRLAATTTLNNITTLGSLSLPITQTTGTLSVSRGGTGQTSFGQGWLSSDGTTITSSTSPTVAYITATSTTATSTLPLLSTNALTINGQYFTSLWSTTTDSLAFDTRLAATTTLNNITTLLGLTDLISTRATTTNATSTNFFATTASSTNLYTTRLSVATTSQQAAITVQVTGGDNALFLGRTGTANNLAVAFEGGRTNLKSPSGFFNLSNAFSVNQVKQGLITMGNYDDVTYAPRCFGGAQDTGTVGPVFIGGGFVECLAATTVDFFTAENASTTVGSLAMRIAGGGNVGIGTTSPYAKLSVAGQTVAQYFTATSTTATSTLPLLSTTAIAINGQYFTSFWSTTTDSLAFDTRLAATTTLNNITTLGSLSLPITQTTGTLSVSRGGTGQTSFGQGWLSSDGTTITSSTSPTVAYITATSTTATSTLPYVSSRLIYSNRLDLYGNTSTDETVINISGDDDYARSISFSESAIEDGYLRFDHDTNNFSLINKTAGELALGTNNLTRLLITSAGNVGIGTTSPYAKLSVAGQTVAEYFTATSTTATSTFPLLSTNALSLNGNYVTSIVGGTGQQNRLAIWSSSNTLTSENSVAWDDLNNTLVLPTLNATNSASILQLASTTILRADNSLGNFFAGQDAGISTASGSYNTGIGQNALQDLTTGAANTALGQGALTAITEGSYNIGFGYNTLSTLLTGSSNVVLGSSALPSFTSGDDNIVIGSSAGNTLTTGSRNILIGSLADITDSISNSVAIGYNSRVTASNSFVLGNNVNVGIGTTSPYAKLSVAGQTVAEYVTATSTTATSTFPLLSTNAIAINGQYFTSLWGTTTDSLAFDTRLAATSTLNNLNILGGLASIGSTTGTTTFLGNSIVNGNFSVGSSTPWGKFVVQNTGTGPSFLVEDSASDTTPFVIDASGNVGIGTSTPSVKFEIGGSATGNRVLFDTSASSNRTLSFERNSVSNAWSIQSSLTNTGTAASLMLNPNGGSIGIGTTTTSLPAVLSVSGGAYLTGNVYVEGDIEARGKITATSTRTQYMGNTGVRTYYAYGDSITQGSSPTTAANHYTAIISRTFGYTLDNQGVNGSVLEEDGQIDAIYAQPVSTSTVATLLTGYNNHRYYGTTASRLDTFKQALPAALAYLAIPDGQKVFAPNFSTTGSWSATTTYATTSGRFTRSAGATASTVLYGNTIYVVGTRGASTDTGTFTLTVDGVDKGTYSCAGVGSSFTDSRVYAPFMMRVGNLSNGQHNVTVTSNNTGYCEINWAAGNGSNGIDGIPAVYVGGALRMTDAAYVSNGVNGSLESNKLYNQVVENVTKTLASDGLNVIQVEAEQVYDPATMDSGDLVHPGDRGHYALAQAFIKKMTGTSFGAEKNFARFFNGYLPKFTIGAGTSTIFTFDGETGRFGVGTSSPIQALSINGNAWITGNATSSTFTATSTTASSTLPLLQSTRISVATSLSIGTTSQSEELVVGDTAVIGNELSILELGSQTDAGIYFGNDTNTGLFAPALDNFAITTGGTERLRIDSVGDIGIGSTSPFARLSVDTNGLTTSIPSFSIGSSTKTDFMIQGLSGNISIGTTTSNRGKIEISHPSPSPVINIDGSASGADVFRLYRSNANGGTGNYGMALKIQTSNPSFVFRSGVSSSLEGTILNAVSHISSTDAMVFSTSTAVTLTNTGIEPMYLKNASSNIGIAGTSTPWGSLSVNGIYQQAGEPTFVIGSSTKTDFVVHQSGFVGVGTTSPWRTFSTNGSVAMNGLTTAAGTPSSICMNTTTKEVTVNAATSCVVSDRDQKQNIQDLSVSGLDAIRAIKTVTFSYNDIPGRSRIGFIAQDLQAVDNRLGDAFDKDGVARSIDIPAIMSVTVKAVQELDTKVDTNNVFVQSLASSTEKALQEQKNKPLSLTFENGFKFEINQATSTEKYLQINSSTGAEVITFDEAGNIGIGDTTPDYKLQVAGDIAATAFVNVSTRESKKDITYLDDEEKMDVLKKLSTIKIAQYRYKLEDPENPLRLGLIAEEAPTEVLSASGKGVDIYKLSTFTLGAVQAQQKKISELEIRLSALEAQVASSTPAIPSDMLASFMDGMKNIFTDSLTVGSATKPSGITLFDEKTGEPYCIKVVNGEMKSTAGKCTVVKIEEPTEIVDEPTETEEVSTTTATTTPSAPEVKEEPKPTASSTPSTPSSPSTPSTPDPKPVEEAPKAEEPKVEEPKVEAPAPVVEAPKVEAPKEEVKSEEPKAEEPKAEAPKVEEKKEEPKQEESKPAESAPSSSESSSVDTN